MTTIDVCDTDPGFEVDLAVTAKALTLGRWHLGHIDWPTALRIGEVRVTGPQTPAREIPTWNLRSHFASTRPHQVMSTKPD